MRRVQSNNCMGPPPLARGSSWDQICVLACRIRLWRGHITLSGSSRSAEPRDHPRGFPGGCCPTSRRQSPVMLIPSCHSERIEESRPRLIPLPQASRPGPFFQRRHPGPPFAEPSFVPLVASLCHARVSEQRFFASLRMTDFFPCVILV